MTDFGECRDAATSKDPSMVSRQGPMACEYCETPTADEARKYSSLGRALYSAGGGIECPEWIWRWIRRLAQKAHEVRAAPPHIHLN